MTVAALCAAPGVARASFYRRLRPRVLVPCKAPARKLSPPERAAGLGAARVASRSVTLAAAFRATQERFPNGVPLPPELPTAVWINKPKPIAESDVPSTRPPCGWVHWISVSWKSSRPKSVRGCCSWMTANSANPSAPASSGGGGINEPPPPRAPPRT